MAPTQCPVDGCEAWSNRWGKKSHPLPTSGFTLKLSDEMDTGINVRICQKCYQCHLYPNKALDGRIRVDPPPAQPPPASGIAALLEAAEQKDPPSVPVPPMLLPPSPSAQSSPLPTPILATVVSSPLSSTPSPKRKLKRHFGTDITASTKNRPGRHHSTSFIDKVKLVREYDKQPYGDKNAWLARRDMTYETVCKFKRAVKKWGEMNKRDRPNQKRRRLDGGGRRAMLSSEMESDILEWVKLRRGGDRDHFAHVVTIRQLIAHASLVSGKTLTEGWVWGFMERQRLSLRTITTGKVSDSPLISGIVEEFRYLNRELLKDFKKGAYIFNMDETAIFYDDNGKRTIDFRGASTVAAHNTKKATNRVTVVIYISADGVVGPPLLIFPASRLTPIAKLTTNKGRIARKALVAQWNKPERFTVKVPVFDVLDEDEVLLDNEGEADAASSTDIALARQPPRPAETITARQKRLRARMAELASSTKYEEVVAYRAKNEKGWMVSELMVAWLTDVFVANAASDDNGMRHLYMDNMGAHETASVQCQMIESGIRFHPLPPNCSHILQPLDHSLNATVKYVYRLLHARWLLRPIEQGVLATITRRDPELPQVMMGVPPKRKRPPKRKLELEEVKEVEEVKVMEEIKVEEEDEEEEKGDSRTRGPRQDEVEVRIVASVYALSGLNIIRSWQHTLNGPAVMEAAIAGHNQRERDGCQITIPEYRKKKSKKREDVLAQEQLEELHRMQEEEEEKLRTLMGDDLYLMGDW